MNRFHLWQTRFFWLVFCVFGLLCVTLVWVFNLERIINGPWATVLSVLCTVLSVFFAFLQWHVDFSHVSTSTTSTVIPFQRNLPYSSEALGVNKRRGALVVRGRKKDLGAPIHLCSGFIVTPFTVEIAAHIVEHQPGVVFKFVAAFPALKPGNYTVFQQSLPYYTFVTVHAGMVARVDWCTRTSNRHVRGGTFQP